jgi:hypothetical protein
MEMAKVGGTINLMSELLVGWLESVSEIEWKKLKKNCWFGLDFDGSSMAEVKV